MIVLSFPIILLLPLNKRNIKGKNAGFNLLYLERNKKSFSNVYDNAG